MPAIVNPNSPDQTTEGQLRALAAALKDLANNNIQAPYSLTVGAGGITDSGPTVLNGGNTVTGGETVDTLTVTGAANLNGGGTGHGMNFTGGTTTTGGASTDSLTASGNVTANGQVNSAGSPLMSQPSYNYLVTTSYKAVWQDGVTYQLGYSPSAEATKTDLVAMTAADAAKLLNVTPYWGRYLWDDPTSPLKAFLLAEQVQAAGFGPDVAPVVEGEPLEMLDQNGKPILGSDGKPIIIPVGQAYTLNYSQMVVALIAAWHDASTRLTTLERYVQELASKTGTTLS